MIIRTFTAPNVRDALQKVRQTLGADAVILDTKFGVPGPGLRGSSARGVSVTAAAGAGSTAATRPEVQEGPHTLYVTGMLADGSGPDATPAPVPDKSPDAAEVPLPNQAPSDAWAASIAQLNDVVRRLNRTAHEDRVWPLFHRWMATQSELSADVVDAFASSLAESLPPADPFLETRRSAQNVLFVGGRGVGRSTALFNAAAARWKARGRKPRLLVAADSAEHGQYGLAAWCAQCGIELAAADLDNADALKRVATDSDDDLFIEYVPGAKSGDFERTAKTLRRRLKPDIVVFVLAATGSSEAWLRDSERFAPFRPSHLLVTHWDELQPWWDVFNIARIGGLLPAYRIQGIDPINSIEPFTATDLRTGLGTHLSLEIHPASQGDK